MNKLRWVIKEYTEISNVPFPGILIPGTWKFFILQQWYESPIIEETGEWIDIPMETTEEMKEAKNGYEEIRL
jgi:hypothetical protein